MSTTLKELYNKTKRKKKKRKKDNYNGDTVLNKHTTNIIYFIHAIFPTLCIMRCDLPNTSIHNATTLPTCIVSFLFFYSSILCILYTPILSNQKILRYAKKFPRYEPRWKKMLYYSTTKTTTTLQISMYIYHKIF